MVTHTCQVQPNPNDLALVMRAKIDRRAFEILFDRYWDRVFRYCYVRTSDWHLAEDLASQTFLNALSALDRFQGESESSFRCWLFTIARNAITESHRYHFRHPVAELSVADLIASNERSLEDEAIYQERFDQLIGIIDKLPADQRELLELRAAGLKSAEIAAILGRSTAAVRQAQSRIVRGLRTQLAASDDAQGLAS